MSSSVYAQKPENALRRAQELESIQQPEAALVLLHEVLSVRRNYRAWSPIYEKIMLAYIDLCLSLNKAREAKDGLHQYRNLTQAQAPGSLEIVVKYIIDEAEKKCREAKDQAVDTQAAASAADLGDDEDDEDGAIAAPNIVASSSNILLLSTMTTDPEQNQRDSALLLPRIKFLWEAYRAVLDILKSNSKLEKLYHMTAIGALQFCSTYKRRTEFKRLCDLLRNHLQNLQKYGASTLTKGEDVGKQNSRVRGWEGWTNESIELHLQTRFSQLETASTLHLYTEGFRTVEDIFNILQISHARRKGAVAGSTSLPKPKLMATYYEKLTTLFWVSENYLFHAFAWYKFYSLCREYNRGMTPEQKQYQASAVLLSALCIPALPDSVGKKRSDFDGSAITATVQDDIAKEKTARMATLLGFHTRNPTREALLSEIRTKNIMADVPQYLRDLYKLMEECSNPLILFDRARPLLDRLRLEVAANETSDQAEPSGLSIYVNPLISVLLLKLLNALSASYHTISLDHIKQLTSGLGVTFTQVEKAIVASATGDIHGYSRSSTGLRVRIDHRSNCLRFGDAAIGSTGAARFESDAMRSRLTILSKQLSFVCNIIDPPDLVTRSDNRQALYAEIRATVDLEHDEMLARKDLIEKRKEEVERMALEKLKEEELKRLEAQANAKAEEERRLQREQLLREREKMEKIRKEMEIAEKKRYLQAMGQATETMTEEELLAIDTAVLAKQHAEEAAKKKDNAEKKVREMQKTLDYVVRATRIEEIPLVKKRQEDKVRSERDHYEAEVVEKAKSAKLQWEVDCQEKSDLTSFSVFNYMNQFQRTVMAGRKVIHEALCKAEDERALQEAEMGKLQRARKRKQEAERRRKLEEERQKTLEEEKKKEEERRCREIELKEKEQAEEMLMKKEEERMAEQGRKEREKEVSVPPVLPPKAPDTAPVSSSGKYVPPSKRGTSDAKRFSGDSSRDIRGSSYGGGRYEGGNRPTSSNERWR